MKKIRKNIVLSALAAFSLLASCVNNDEYDFASTEKPMVTAPQTEFTVAEGETLSIPVEIDNPINRPMTFKLEVVDGDAETDVDYMVDAEPSPGDWGFPGSGYRIDVPAYAESFEIPIEAIQDLIPQEETRTVQLRLSTAGVRTGLTQEGGILFTIHIEEFESEDFLVRLEWDATYIDAEGEAHDFCDYDLDLELYDSNNNLVAYSWADCPEEIRITPGDLPDGTYYLDAIYFASYGAPVPVDYNGIPATITYAKPGVFAHQVDMSETWTNLEAGLYEGNTDGTTYTVVLEVSGTTYTISNLDGNVLAQGRMNFERRLKKVK